MDAFDFVFVLILGISLGIIVSILSFVDLLSMLSIIFPDNMPSDFKEHKDFVSSKSYQIHKRRWKKTFIWVSVVYAVVYCVIAMLFDSILIGFYSAIVVSAFYLGIASNIEHKHRKLLICKFRREKTVDDSTNNTGDGSLS
ncbi:MAG: hypothetical protein IJZ63_01250 [Clostridia bacterium]|nr:hypothetical protein [Clostridia bacterium]